MGNHYRYQLVVHSEVGESEEAAVMAANYIRGLDDVAEFFIDENGGNQQGEEGEWDFMDVLVEVSGLFPSWRIVLYVDDDCANEHQVHYFVNGAYYWDDGEISYPKFDPARLERGRYEQLSAR